MNLGWLLRYTHATARLLFSWCFVHSSAASITAPTSRRVRCLDFLGVVILLLMMATAFMGYVAACGGR